MPCNICLALLWASLLSLEENTRPVLGRLPWRSLPEKPPPTSAAMSKAQRAPEMACGGPRDQHRHFPQGSRHRWRRHAALPPIPKEARWFRVRLGFNAERQTALGSSAAIRQTNSALGRARASPLKSPLSSVNLVVTFPAPVPPASLLIGTWHRWQVYGSALLCL